MGGIKSLYPSERALYDDGEDEKLSAISDRKAPPLELLFLVRSVLYSFSHDNSLWALPGGAMEIGESIAETARREVKEETGLDVIPEYIVGIYSDPKHIIALADGEVRQQFSICFACRIIGGEIAVSDESFAVNFFSLEEIERLNMHRSSLVRIKHYLEHRSQPVIS